MLTCRRSVPQRQPDEVNHFEFEIICVFLRLYIDDGDLAVSHGADDSAFEGQEGADFSADAAGGGKGRSLSSPWGALVRRATL